MPRSNRRKPRDWVLEEMDSRGEWSRTEVFRYRTDGAPLWTETIYRKNQRVGMEKAMSLLALLAQNVTCFTALSFQARNVKTEEIVPFEIFL